MTIAIATRNSLTKKMRLRVWGYTNGEYFYMLLDGGLSLKYKTYIIKLEKDEVELWKGHILKRYFGIWVEGKDKEVVFYVHYLRLQNQYSFRLQVRLGQNY